MAIPLQPLSFNPSQDEWNAWMSQVVQWAQGVNTVTTGLPVTAQGIQNLVYNTQSTANISLLEIVPTLPASGSFDGQLVYQQSDENLYTWSATNNQWKHTAPQYKGEWNSTTLYYAGDEVSYQGLVYIATADNQNMEPDINPSVWAELSQTIPNLDGIANGSVYGKTLLTYLFNGRPFNYKGAYSALATYFQSDEVSWTGNYYLYINPTAQSGITPTNDGINWVLVGPGTLDSLLNGTTYGKVNLSSISGGVPYTFRGAYSATTTYRQGDEVSYQNNYYLYIDSVPTSGATPTNGGYWILVGPTELSAVPGTIAAGQIPSAVITGSMIANATITANNITSGTITGTQIASGTITGSNIQTGTITGTNISSATINGSNIATGTITGTNIATGTITGSNIQGGTITGTQIANATITASNIATATITAAQISSTAGITGSQIAAATISGSNIAASTISGSNIENLTITAAQIANLTITNNQIANGTIGSSQIASGGVTGSNIASATITAGNIANGAITATQIANATITATQIANATITGTQIASGTITGTNLASATITGSQIASATITATNIANLTITGSKIANSTITATQMSVSQLSAITADLGTITAGTIIFDNGTYEMVQGIGFGGSSNLILWFGPHQSSISDCTKANAIMYIATDGSSYFGGAVAGSQSGGTNSTYNTAGTYTETIPAGKTQCVIELWGDTGDGQTGQYVTYGTQGGGGGSGSYCRSVVNVSGQAGKTFTITIRGGASGLTSTVAAGTVTGFSTMSASTGGNGATATTTAGGAGGSPAAAGTGGTVSNLPGNAGSAGTDNFNPNNTGAGGAPIPGINGTGNGGRPGSFNGTVNVGLPAVAVFSYS